MITVLVVTISGIEGHDPLEPELKVLVTIYVPGALPAIFIVPVVELITKPVGEAVYVPAVAFGTKVGV